jgi:hypothetical protein
MGRFESMVSGVRGLWRSVMPAKKSQMADEKRDKRLRETAPEVTIENGPESFERAFERILLRPDLEQRERKT